MQHFIGRVVRSARDKTTKVAVERVLKDHRNPKVWREL